MQACFFGGIIFYR